MVQEASEVSPDIYSTSEKLRTHRIKELDKAISWLAEISGSNVDRGAVAQCYYALALSLALSETPGSSQVLPIRLARTALAAAARSDLTIVARLMFFVLPDRLIPTIDLTVLNNFMDLDNTIRRLGSTVPTQPS